MTDVHRRFQPHDDVVLFGTRDPSRSDIGVVRDIDGQGVHVHWEWGNSTHAIDDLEHYEGPITGRHLPPEKGPRKR